MKVTLSGKERQILNNMITDGYASTKSEAIRLAIITFDMKSKSEEEMVEAKINRIESETRARKRKVLNSNEALGAYAKYVK